MVPFPASPPQTIGDAVTAGCNPCSSRPERSCALSPPPRTHSQGQKQPRSPQSGTSTTTETSHLRPAQSSKRRSAPIEASLDERASARSQAGPPWGHPVVLGAVASQVSSLAELPDLGTCHGRHFSVRGVSGGRVPARRGSCCWYVPCNTRSARHEILPSTNLRRASPRGLL